jgi:mxaJ protein
MAMRDDNRTAMAGRDGRAESGMHRSACGVSPLLPIAAALALMLYAAAGAAGPGRVLRVCADPDNLPFSNDRGEGFENKIAQVIANDLNASLRYTWHSQRRGFIRQTLKAGECDLVVGVPAGYDLVLSTKPYYRSSYVFVYAKKSGLDLHSFDDPALRRIRIGLHAFGEDGANSPPTHALGRRGITRNVVGYTILDTADSPPGKIIDAVAAGDIDVAIVWGPFAGYFAMREKVPLKVVPVASGPTAGIDASLPFVYAISMGVRRGDTAFKEMLEGSLERRRADIRKVLEEYGVPLAGEPPGSNQASGSPPAAGQ